MRFIKVLKTRGGKSIDLGEVEPKVREICGRYKIDLLYLFGSYATGRQGRLSDVDVAYLAREKVDEASLLLALQDVFEDEAIDVVNLSQAPPQLVHTVLKEGRCLFCKSRDLKLDFELRAERIYWDTRRLREEYFKRMLERVRNGTFGQ
jgi:hypothetical protein